MTTNEMTINERNDYHERTNNIKFIAEHFILLGYERNYTSKIVEKLDDEQIASLRNLVWLTQLKNELKRRKRTLTAMKEIVHRHYDLDD